VEISLSINNVSSTLEKNPLDLAVKDLKVLNAELAQLRRTSQLRQILKIIGIGFFLYRDVDLKISQNENKKILIIKSLESRIIETSKIIKAKLDEVDASHEFLSEDQENNFLFFIDSFKENIRYIESLNFIDSSLITSRLAEAAKSKDFIINFNEKLKIRKLREEIIALKDQFLQAEREFTILHDQEKYFSKSELNYWKKRWNHLVPKSEIYISKKVGDLEFGDSINLVFQIHSKGEQIIMDRNEEYIHEEISKLKLFEDFDGHPLSDEQRRAIAIDEANNLIVAGAGTGKTTTLIGKAFYIVSKKLATPEEILLVAFNKSVVKSNIKRINHKLGLKFPVKTYHKLGLEIIGQGKGESPSLSPLWEDSQKLNERILEFIDNRMKEEDFAKLVIEYFFKYYLSYKSVFEFNSLGEYYRYLKEKKVVSLKGDKVKSFEECEIANYLYFNGIIYDYEKDYQVKTADAKHRQYKPDFFLPKYNIYIEHFGIDRNNRPAPWISQIEYNEQMEWKEKTHMMNRTELIKTYSYEKKEDVLLKNLLLKLLEKNVELNPLPYQQILKKINRLKLNFLASLLCTFLDLYKSSGKSLEELRAQVGYEDERPMTFLKIFSIINEDYDDDLRKQGHIDFNDMINDATILVEQKNYLSPYKYILVDEFQDISQSRYRLLKSLLRQNDAKLFCVGDDWQSIYRFNGVDISIMLDFERNFGVSEITSIEETRRFGNKLCDFSTKFILENPAQIRKKITSKEKQDMPAVTIIKEKTEVALERIIKDIEETPNHSLLDRNQLWILNRFRFKGRPKNLKELAEDYPNFDISYKTIHGSKGLETDYVAIIGLNNSVYGFPSQIRDDPVLNLVLANPEQFENAEERRLFYVSVTRARKHVYLVVDDSIKASTFISEIEKNGYETSSIGEVAKMINCEVCKTGTIIDVNLQSDYRCSNEPYCNYIPHTCPECGTGFLFRKESDYLSEYRCSNEKCAFHAETCPKCEDGYKVKRGGYSTFYGCSNYHSKDCRYKFKECPECETGFLFKKESGYLSEYKCSNEKCLYRIKACPKCEDGHLKTRYKGGQEFYGCSNFPLTGCGHMEKITS